MSFQDRAQHQIGQIDKEVCVFSPTTFSFFQNTQSLNLITIWSPFGLWPLFWGFRWSYGSIAFQVSSAQQPREADLDTQSLCFSRPCFGLLFLDILQYCRRVPCQLCGLFNPRILLSGCLVQCEQNRWYSSTYNPWVLFLFYVIHWRLHADLIIVVDCKFLWCRQAGTWNSTWLNEPSIGSSMPSWRSSRALSTPFTGSVSHEVLLGWINY